MKTQYTLRKKGIEVSNLHSMMTTPTLQFVLFVLKLLQGQVSKAHQVSVCVKAKPNPSFENKKVTYLQNHRQQHSCSLFLFVSF